MNVLRFKCHVKMCVCVCAMKPCVHSLTTAPLSSLQSGCHSPSLPPARPLTFQKGHQHWQPCPHLSSLHFFSFHASFLNPARDSFLIGLFLRAAPSPTFPCSFPSSLSQLSLRLPAFSRLSPSPLTFKLRPLSASSSSSLCSQREGYLHTSEKHI